MTRTSLSRIIFLLALCCFLPPPATSQDVPEGSPEAIAAFAEGMKFYVAQNYNAALPHFMRAHELDNTFIVSLFMASLVQGNMSNAAEARSLREEVWAQRDRLSPYYRNRLETQMALSAGDRTTALREAREAAAVGPGTKALYNLAYIANGHLRAEEALEALDALDPDLPPMRGWYGYHGVRAGALHQLGRFGEEVLVGREAWQDFPTRQAALTVQARALGALGDEQGLERLWDACTAVEPSGVNYTPGALMTVAASEAFTHGHPELGQALFDDAARWWEDQGLEGASAPVRNWYSLALYGAGRLDDAFEVVESVLDELPESGWYHAAAGMVAAARGDMARAELEKQWLAVPRENIQPWNRAQYRGYLSAAMGEDEAAVALLEEAVGHGMFYNVWWHRHPAFFGMLDHEGFQEFLAPIG